METKVSKKNIFWASAHIATYTILLPPSIIISIITNAWILVYFVVLMLLMFFFPLTIAIGPSRTGKAIWIIYKEAWLSLKRALGKKEKAYGCGHIIGEPNILDDNPLSITAYLTWMKQ
jgi:hypothetical protein